MKQYFYTDEKFEQQGPIDESLLIENYKAGKYKANTKVWCEGMADWKDITPVMKDLGFEQAIPVSKDESKSVADKAQKLAEPIPKAKSRTTRKEREVTLARLISFCALAYGFVLVTQLGAVSSSKSGWIGWMQDGVLSLNPLGILLCGPILGLAWTFLWTEKAAKSAYAVTTLIIVFILGVIF